MSKHTQGPFRVGGDGVDAVWVSPPNGDENVLCDIVGRQDTDAESAVITDEDRANADLFAAAPELLTAAKRALAVLKATGESVRPTNALGALAAAIKKAEGAA